MQLVSFLRKTKTCGIVGHAAAIHVLLILKFWPAQGGKFVLILSAQPYNFKSSFFDVLLTVLKGSLNIFWNLFVVSLSLWFKVHCNTSNILYISTYTCLLIGQILSIWHIVIYWTKWSWDKCWTRKQHCWLSNPKAERCPKFYSHVSPQINSLSYTVIYNMFSSYQTVI